MKVANDLLVCYAEGCSNSLTSTDLHFNGRFCMHCIRSKQWIVTRAQFLVVGDVFKYLSTGEEIRVKGKTDKVFELHTYVPKSGEKNTIGVNSQVRVYLKNQYFKSR